MKRGSSVLRSLPVLSLVLSIACCKQAAPPREAPARSDPAPTGSVAERIERINRRCDRAVVEGDLATQLACLADSVVIDPPLAPPIEGIAALRAAFEKDAADSVRFHAFTTTTTRLWTSDGKAYERGRWGAAISSKSHPQPAGFYGGYFQIWTLRDSIPRVEYLIYNLDHPAESIGD